MFMAAMDMVLPWKIVEDFQSFIKYKTLPFTSKIYLARKWVWRAHIGLVWKLGFRAIHITFCFTTFLVRPSIGAQQSHERAPKNVQMTLKDQSFVNKLKVSFVCLPEDVWLPNFGKCLKMPQR
jgi:hypothetical protein